MKALKRISLVILAVVALNACNDSFDDFQVKDGINDGNVNKDLNIKGKDNPKGSDSQDAKIR